MQKWYIKTTKYSLQERQTAKGKVYDVIFRVIDSVTLEERQKKLSGYKTKTLAKQGYTDFVTAYCELLKDKSVVKKKDPKKDKLIVEPLIAEYLSTLTNQNKASTVYSKKFIYRDFVLPYLGDKPLSALTAQELYKWQDTVWNMKNKRTGAFYSYRYLMNARGFLTTFLSWAESRYGVKNHMEEVKRPRPRQPKRKMQIWTRDEFEKFIAAVDEPTYHCLFTLMFFTGRRKGELYALSVSDIKGDRITWDKSVTRKTFTDDSYEVTSTKADKEQTLPVCKRVQEEIKTYMTARAKGNAFFFGGDRPLADSTTMRNFKEYCKKAEVPIIRMHDLRHSFVSMLIHLGANFMVVADLIGDTVEQVTKTYGHMYESDKQAIIDML